FQAEDGIRDFHVTGVQTCALPIWNALSTAVPVNISRLTVSLLAWTYGTLASSSMRLLSPMRPVSTAVPVVVLTWRTSISPIRIRSEERRVGRGRRCRRTQQREHEK